MCKYSVEFKRSVVAAFEGGWEGAGAVAARFGIDHSTVRLWAAAHAAHGLAGLARKFSRYDAAFKLSVLQRMWDDGLSYRQVAAVFDIRNKGCLADWERRCERGGLEALAPRRRERPRLMSKPPAEFSVEGEKLYISPVMDLFNGEIIAFETARRPVLKLVDTMLAKALDTLGSSEKPILHSDQGWQYRMPAYQRRLQAQGIV